MELDFAITAKDHNLQDMYLIKFDMIKFEGYWEGYFIDPETLEKVTFDSFPGLVESANSVF
jgi:hypothetical protein